MNRTTNADRAKSVEIIADTFDANPSVNTVIGSGGNRRRKISRLADYAFIKAINRDGAYLSKNEMGAALVFRSDAGRFSIKELYYEVRFAFSIPVKKVIQTLKREAYLKKNRFQGTHIYFWFLGVQKGGGSAVFEMKDFVYGYAQKEKLPILLETSVYRNVVAYERYGFKTYHVWDDPYGGMKLYFMKWEPK